MKIHTVVNNHCILLGYFIKYVGTGRRMFLDKLRAFARPCGLLWMTSQQGHGLNAVVPVPNEGTVYCVNCLLNISLLGLC